jgi:hypothetical protein
MYSKCHYSYVSSNTRIINNDDDDESLSLQWLLNIAPTYYTTNIVLVFIYLWMLMDLDALL